MYRRNKKQLLTNIILALSVINIVNCYGATTMTHREFQNSDSNGVATLLPYSTTTEKVTLEGIILNNPEEMLDSRSGAPSVRGGQWQIFFQSDDAEDHAGTCIWFGQDYVGVGTGTYSEQEYQSEVYRINHDPNTAYMFRAGDKVKVTGAYKFYKGKMNINEIHQVDPKYDFDIELIEPRVGMPLPDVAALSELKDASDKYIFDAARDSGCEYYQGCIVRINNVTVVNPENWGPDNTITITDDTGRTFPVILGHGYGITAYECPTGNIDIIGIMDQEATNYAVCTDGYRLYLCNYDGNGQVLTDFGKFKNHIDGDIDMDGDVDLADFGRLAENWLNSSN